MKTRKSNRMSQSLYTAAWKHLGPGVLIALMFVVVTFTLMLREQTSVAGLVRSNNRDGMMAEQHINALMTGPDSHIIHSVEMTLPIDHLRSAEGKITPNGESFFLLLARRMKTLSLNIKLTADSSDDVPFLSSIAARILREVSLESTQIRIGVADRKKNADLDNDAAVTVTSARYESVAGDRK